MSALVAVIAVTLIVAAVWLLAWDCLDQRRQHAELRQRVTEVATALDASPDRYTREIARMLRRA